MLMTTLLGFGVVKKLMESAFPRANMWVFCEVDEFRWEMHTNIYYDTINGYVIRRMNMPVHLWVSLFLRLLRHDFVGFILGHTSSVWNNISPCDIK